MGKADASGTEDDPFVILGVSRDCTPSELKQVYRLLARRYHPDVNSSPEAVAHMCRINLAYDRAWEVVAITDRPRRRRSAAMADVTQPWGPQPAAPPATQRPVARPPRRSNPFGLILLLFVRVAAAPARLARVRRAFPRLGLGRGRPRATWAAAAASVVAVTLSIVLIIVVAAHVLTPASPTPRGTSGTPTANPPGLRLGGTTIARWPDTGSTTLSEHLVAQFSTAFHLDEAPQWSPDGTYVTVSVSPAQRTSRTTPSTILLLHDGHLLATLQGSSARWSPVADQLAVLTNPASDGMRALELVSPAASGTPTVLDPRAGTHLAWSDDGAQIAYDSDGQQKLRLATVAQRTSQTLVTERGQHLLPIGWQGGQIVGTLHNGNAVSLVEVDPALGRFTTLADLGSTANEATVTVSHGSVTYVPRTSAAPFAALNWTAPQQHWQVQLMGIQSVRFLAGWSADGTWQALAPAPSAGLTSQVCLAHIPTADGPPAAPWAAHCLPLPGTLVGMSWEPHSNTLSYVRLAQPGGQLELRELHIQPTSPVQG